MGRPAIQTQAVWQCPGPNPAGPAVTARRRFEAHLLACEPCWQEVVLGRRGRQLAETARDLAPPQLREDIRAAAIASYTADRLPGTAVPAGPAPQLTPLALNLVGAARGELGGVAVAMFAYSTPSGERLTILVSSRPFPEASHARELGGAEGAWTMRASGVTIICAQHTHAMLLLGSDAALVRQAGALLNAI
jgi:hypothetical protein